MTLTGGAQIRSNSGVEFVVNGVVVTTLGGGPAGSIIIAATDGVSISGLHSGLLSEAKGLGPSGISPGQGPGGDITVHAREIRLTEGASMVATSAGTGNAGNIRLTATEGVWSARSTVTAQATRANGGSIEVNAGSRVQLMDSAFTAGIGGGPQTVGGNLTINAPFVILEGSQISATATAGQGGHIQISSNVFLADPAGLVTASSELEIQGTVEIQAPVTSLSGTLAPLPQVFVKVAALLPARCAARFSGGKSSSLVLGGRGGLPLEPGSVLPSPLALGAQLMADPTVTGEPSRQESIARFALLAGHEKTFPRLAGDCAH